MLDLFTQDWKKEKNIYACFVVEKMLWVSWPEYLFDPLQQLLSPDVP